MPSQHLLCVAVPVVMGGGGLGAIGTAQEVMIDTTICRNRNVPVIGAASRALVEGACELCTAMAGCFDWALFDNRSVCAVHRGIGRYWRCAATG